MSGASVRLRRALPFAAASTLGLMLGAVPPGASDVLELTAAVALTLCVLAAMLAAPWARLPAWTQPVPAFVYLLAVALLRDAAGGSNSGYGPLLLLPVFWVALYGTRRQLAAVLAGVAAVFYVPMVAIGGLAYPSTSWRGGGMFVVVAAIVGLTVQSIIERLRRVLADRAELAARLEHLAGTDALTGLANRRTWDERLRRAVAEAARDRRPLAIAVLDLDRFKGVNDLHGHQYGDHVLAESARTWRAELRPADVLARIGGEEFGALLADCPLGGAVSVVDRMRAATPRGHTCSAGVVVWDGSETPAALLARADQALYRAKEQGRDRTVAEPGALHAVVPAHVATA